MQGLKSVNIFFLYCESSEESDSLEWIRHLIPMREDSLACFFIYYLFHRKLCVRYNSELWSLLHTSLSSSNRLESPTRTLTLEAPKGVEVNAGVGEFKASCRKDLTLESSEGEVSIWNCTVYREIYVDVKWIVHPKMKIMSSFTHPQVVTNLH